MNHTKLINIPGYLKVFIVLAIHISVCIFYGIKANADSPSFIISDTKIHRELIKMTSHDYIINLGGTVDMDNTTTRGYGFYEVAFQPNISLEIENVGSNPVIDPWIVINDIRDYRTIDKIIAQATRGASDDQERLMMLYEFARSHRYHDSPLFPRDELHDPVKHFNSYGAGLCDDIGRVTCALAYRAGFTKEHHGGDPMARSMHGHVMSEVAVNGHYQFIDTDENGFYLDPENERPVSGDEITRDSDLAVRDYTYGPLFKSWNTGEKASALLGRDDTKNRSITIGHEMHLTLRPKEKLTLQWDNIGKTPGPRRLKFFGNSFLDYEPEMNETAIKYAYKSHRIEASYKALVGAVPDAFIIYEIKSPYVICGGKVNAYFSCGEKTDNVGVGVSVDGENWSDVWQNSGKGSCSCRVFLDVPLEIANKIARYSYFVRIKLASENKSAKLLELKIHTDLLATPISLPRLSLGQNNIRYTDKDEDSRQVLITHTYQESGNITPPQRPKLQYPADKTVNDDAWIKFKWNEVPGAKKYHIRVSRRHDLKTSYRPCFDVYVDETELCNKRTGFFSTDETYYWSVRARSAEGVWGDWSPIQTFSWCGPNPPIELKTIKMSGKIYLNWKPNPKGEKPVRYEVYASNMKGFKPSRTQYTLLSLGEVPSNLIAETSETELLIVSPDPKEKTPNKSSYRVIAIDEKGTPGGTSWPLELEHPYIYNSPPTEAKAGNPYKHRLLILKSLGDLQYRYNAPGYAFWEREGYEFSLKNAPQWLKIDPKTGIMSGTPRPQDIGETSVTVKVKRTWPYEVTTLFAYQGTNKKDTKSFLKDAPEYQASDEQTFILNVTR